MRKLGPMVDRAAYLVLVVEDDDCLRDSIVMAIELEGYTVQSAANGSQALLAALQSMPNLILLDMRMPVMDGWEFSKKFRARHGRAAPIVVMTASEDAKKRALEVEAQGWIGKPFNLNELFELLGRFLPPSATAAKSL